MTRLIKFRAWDKEFKKMYFNGFCLDCKGNSSDGDVMFDPAIFKRDKYSPFDIVVMQYTGLKDKNGVEIYEGDILKQGKVEDQKNQWKGPVFWSEDTAQFIVNGYSLSVELWTLISGIGCSVIGNIHQHPELLK